MNNYALDKQYYNVIFISRAYFIIKNNKKNKGEFIMSKIKTKEFEVFTYAELSDKAKEVVKQDYLEWNRDADIFKEEVEETILSEYGLNNLETAFSLGYSQGDGLCLYGEISFEELLGDKFKDIAFKGFTNCEMKIFKRLYAEYAGRIDFKKNNHHYNFASTVNIDVDYYCNIPRLERLFDKVIEKLIDNVQEWYYDECRKFESAGYDWFYEASDEEVAEWADSNEYEFLSNGQIF